MVKTSTFGSEFVAMKISVELALCYKLRMFGLPIEGPITKNTFFLESTPEKKHNSNAYHCSREAVAAGTIRVTKEDGKKNLANVLLTKPQGQATKDFLCDRFMY
jgi:hypothetical protein